MKFRALLIGPFCALAWLPLAPAASGQAEPGTPSVTLAPSTRFRFDAGAPLVAPAGVAADGTVCVGTVDGYVHALGSDGGYRWSHSVHGAVTRRPLSAGQLWYIATSAERVYALSVDGTLYWVFKPPSPVASELVADATGTLFFVAADHSLYGVSAHGGVTLRAAFGELKAGPSVAPDGAIWAENQAGSAISVQGRAVRHVASGAPPEFEFPELDALRDPDGRRWRGRADGVLELRATPGAEPSLLTLAHSPLFAPVWSASAHYAVLSARSGAVFAVDPGGSRSSR